MRRPPFLLNISGMSVLIIQKTGVKSKEIVQAAKEIACFEKNYMFLPAETGKGLVKLQNLPQNFHLFFGAAAV